MKTRPERERDTSTETTATGMDEIWVQGGRRLHGSVAVGGSKNATLPILAATLLAPGLYRFTNVPDLKDI
jgi:UDP-N-acetylglucosamine 1-carboxyvinyltransferase